MELKLIIPLPQSVNHIYGRNKFGSTYLKKEGKDYKKTVGEYIKKEVVSQKWDKLKEGEYCYLDEIVYMNAKGRDADNLKKLTQDTITETMCVWYDDTYCLPRTNRIYINSENPRIELTLTPTNTVGVFDCKKDCDEFENNCIQCKRYKRNCSILKAMKENRIIKDIELVGQKWKCLKEVKID